MNKERKAINTYSSFITTELTTKINKNMTRPVILQTGFSSAVVNIKNKARRSKDIGIDMLTVFYDLIFNNIAEDLSIHMTEAKY